MELATEMNIPNFCASTGWLARFRWRNKAMLADDGTGSLPEAENDEPEQERIVDEDHVPEWVMEIRRKNEKRRLSFPVQATAALPIDNGDRDGADVDIGGSDEEVRVNALNFVCMCKVSPSR